LVPSGLVGSSYVLAREAGAEVRNLHFLQFLLARDDGSLALLKRKFVGELKLRDAKGNDLLEGLRPDDPSAERALLSRAEHYPFSLHDGSGWIDVAVARACERGGCWIESRTERAPISTYAHVSNGGIVVDGHGRCGVEGLFACGEAAGGMHGALRLGGEYVASALVFAARAGRAAGESAAARPASNAALAAEEPIDSEGGLQEGELRNYQAMIRQILTSKAMVVRSRAELPAARGVVEVAERVVRDKGCRDRSCLRAWHETRVMAACARMLLDHAMADPVSAGPHYLE
jgi:aspartate oxidase